MHHTHGTHLSPLRPVTVSTRKRGLGRDHPGRRDAARRRIARFPPAHLQLRLLMLAACCPGPPIPHNTSYALRCGVIFIFFRDETSRTRGIRSSTVGGWCVKICPVLQLFVEKENSRLCRGAVWDGSWGQTCSPDVHSRL